MEQKSIDPEDLVLLEEDLSNDELISVLFLLYGAEKSSWILEKLKSSSNKSLLHDYATHHTNWKTSIVEALAIINVFEVVEGLGIDSSEAREHLSGNPTINPGLKLLYQLCEACTKNTTNMLIKHIKEVCRPANAVDKLLLEVFLLHCISSQVIKVSSSLDDCDFSLITNFFNKNKVDEVEEVLAKFPKKSNSLDNANNNSFNSISSKGSSSSKASSLIGVYASKNIQ